MGRDGILQRRRASSQAATRSPAPTRASKSNLPPSNNNINNINTKPPGNDTIKMPPLVRRRPLIERLKAWLDPLDLLLWLAEELNDDAYEHWLQLWSTPIGLALNIVFILATGASRRARGRGSDDVFGDEYRSGTGWFAWLVRSTLPAGRVMYIK